MLKADLDFEKGEFSNSEKSFLEAKKIARTIGDLSLEITITKNYTNKFLNISSIAENLELILELKNWALLQNIDSLTFKMYRMTIQQYVVLGERMDLRKQCADSMLIIAKRLDRNDLLAFSYYSLGTATNGSEAIQNYRNALNFSNWEEDKVMFSSTLNNLSNKYRIAGDYVSALNCADSAYIASEAIGREEGMAASMYRSAQAYLAKGDFDQAIIDGKESLRIFKSAGILRRQDNCAMVISDAYRGLGDYKDALYYFELRSLLEDSLKLMLQSDEALFVDRKMEYELTSKKDSLSYSQEREINSLELENVNNLLTKERMQRYVLFGGGAVGLVFIIVLWVMIHRIRKDNNLIALQKTLVEDKNKEIMASIAYAKRIQSAILPQAKLVKEFLKESFILYKPKDIVAGDFYWMETVGKKVLFAAADCTGHGVPGAMVSVVCNNALNRSVREHGITDPGEILNGTRSIVVQEFEKSSEDVKDGMDIAICTLEGYTLEYAGANNPLWIVRNGELLITKANKQPIGKFDNPEPYTSHTVQLQKEDTIYIFSDGYVDQFGGEKGKKFKAAAFKELLLGIQPEPMESQKKILDETFESWKGDNDQVDDVCVIGVRV
ncbi:MAG: SpoIIE family protein phosphatase [Crocinitomicaceae bacterium]|nr:SpoIIE family protein phosphatase [Crocinitomicaceae bacterium]